MNHGKKENSVWYCKAEEGAAHGPYSAREVKRLYYSGSLGTEVLVWREGMAEWLPYRACFGISSVLGAVIGGVTGLRGMGNMNFRRFFSRVFKRHTFAEARETLRGAQTEDTVYLDGSWPSPWLYSRVLLWGVAGMAILFGIYLYLRETSLYLSIPFAAFVAPFAMFVLFTEMNVRRDLSMSKAFWSSLLLVPIITLPLAAELNGHFNDMSIAGLTEEPTKLLTALVIARLFRIRCNRILRGMMLGSAVGMSFAFWETITYIASAYSQGGWWGAVGNAVMRASNEPFAHALWTAVTMGAFCAAQGQLEQQEGGSTHMVRWKTLRQWSFLRIAIIPVLAHSAHNWSAGHLGEFSLLIGSMIIICHIGLYLISWELALQLLKAGLRQARGQAIEKAAPGVSPQYPPYYSLSLRGRMSGRTYLRLGIALLIIALACIINVAESHGYPLYVIVLMMYTIYAVLLSIAATVRRLHDIGLSGWWAPVAVPLVWCIIPGIVLSRMRSAPLQEPTPAEPPAPTISEQTLPELPLLVSPGVHEQGIFCPACNGRGGLTAVHPCAACGGTGLAPLLPPQAIPHTDAQVSRPLHHRLLPALKGRLTRRYYWGLTAAVALLISAAAHTEHWLLVCAALWSVLLYIGATVRRLHDIDRSGWWAVAMPFSMILMFTPWAALYFIDSRPGENAWGPNPKAAGR